MIRNIFSKCLQLMNFHLKNGWFFQEAGCRVCHSLKAPHWFRAGLEVCEQPLMVDQVRQLVSRFLKIQI